MPKGNLKKGEFGTDFVGRVGNLSRSPVPTQFVKSDVFRVGSDYLGLPPLPTDDPTATRLADLGYSPWPIKDNSENKIIDDNIARDKALATKDPAENISDSILLPPMVMLPTLDDQAKITAQNEALAAAPPSGSSVPPYLRRKLSPEEEAIAKASSFVDGEDPAKYQDISDLTKYSGDISSTNNAQNKDPIHNQIAYVNVQIQWMERDGNSSTFDKWIEYAPQFKSDQVNSILKKYYATVDNRQKQAAPSRKNPVPASIYVKSLNDIEENEPFSDFILINVSENNSEAYQLIETLGRDIFYSMGSKPLVISLSGLLLNTDGAEWKRNFEILYHEQMKAEATIKNSSRVYVGYDNVVIEGLVLNLSTSISATSPADSNFSMSIYVTNRKFVGYYDAPVV